MGTVAGVWLGFGFVYFEVGKCEGWRGHLRDTYEKSVFSDEARHCLATND